MFNHQKLGTMSWIKTIDEKQFHVWPSLTYRYSNLYWTIIKDNLNTICTYNEFWFDLVRLTSVLQKQKKTQTENAYFYVARLDWVEEKFFMLYIDFKCSYLWQCKWWLCICKMHSTFHGIFFMQRWFSQIFSPFFFVLPLFLFRCAAEQQQKKTLMWTTMREKCRLPTTITITIEWGKQNKKKLWKSKFRFVSYCIQIISRLHRKCNVKLKTQRIQITRKWNELQKQKIERENLRIK